MVGSDDDVVDPVDEDDDDDEEEEEEVEVEEGMGVLPSARACVTASTNSLFSKNALVLIPYDSSSFFNSPILIVEISGRSPVVDAALRTTVVWKRLLVNAVEEDRGRSDNRGGGGVKEWQRSRQESVPANAAMARLRLETDRMVVDVVLLYCCRWDGRSFRGSRCWNSLLDGCGRNQLYIYCVDLLFYEWFGETELLLLFRFASYLLFSRCKTLFVTLLTLRTELVKNEVFFKFIFYWGVGHSFIRLWFPSICFPPFIFGSSCGDRSISCS